MEKVSAMKRCKLLSSCRESFSFSQERRRGEEEEGVVERIKRVRREEERRQVESKRERRRGKREIGGWGRGEGERERKLGMNGRGEEAGEQASSLPGFALLGSSEELRVTDHQTDRADAAASKGTNLSVGTGDHPLPHHPFLPLLPSRTT